MNMRADHATFMLAMVLAAAPTSAQEAPPSPPGPDFEFLEYLGSLVREGDTWIDPTDLRWPAETERDRAAADERDRATEGNRCAQTTAPQPPHQEQ